MLRILDITAPDINNGNGIRITLWVAGCSHKCKGCHNAWTWDYNQGIKFIENKDDILNKLSNWLQRDYVDGITFSGGDPLDQDSLSLSELMQLIKWVRRNYPNKTIWLYTGYEYEKLNKYQKEIADSCDTIVDGPFIEEKKTFDCPFRGSSNQRIIKKRINYKKQ